MNVGSLTSHNATYKVHTTFDISIIKFIFILHSCILFLNLNIQKKGLFRRKKGLQEGEREINISEGNSRAFSFTVDYISRAYLY